MPRSVFFDYQIELERRSALGAFLAEQGIETKLKHPVLLPDQPPYRHLPRPALPMAERLVDRILCLPIHEKLTDDDVRLVARTIREFHERP